MADHAIPIPLLCRIAFWLIVMGEGLTAAFFALGMVELLRARKFKARDFHRAKRFVFAGAACGFPGLVHRVSRRWRRVVCDVAITGLERSAARVSHLRVDFLVLIFVAQPDAELQRAE